MLYSSFSHTEEKEYLIEANWRIARSCDLAKTRPTTRVTPAPLKVMYLTLHMYLDVKSKPFLSIGSVNANALKQVYRSQGSTIPLYVSRVKQ